MHLKLSILALLLSPSFSTAASCIVPEFTEFTLSSADTRHKTIRTSVAGMMKISLPREFDGIALSGDGTVFGYLNNVRIVIGLETSAAIAPHKRNAKPEPFYRDIFMGRTRLGCKYLQAYQLEQQDYRIRSKAGAMDIFSYGKGGTHEVIVLNSDRPDAVIRMRFNGYDRQSLEAILSTITPQ